MLNMSETTISAEKQAYAVMRTARFTQLFCDAVGTERAAELKTMLDGCSLNHLSKMEIDPADYRSARSFALDYAIIKVLSKIEHDGPIDRKAAALSGFKAAERRCESTNIRLFSGGPLPRGVDGILHAAHERIRQIIGERPSFGDIADLMRWGPGATSSIKGSDVRVENKYLESRLTVTPKAQKYAQVIFGSNMHWVAARLTNVPCGPPRPNYEVVGPCSLMPSEFVACNSMRVVTVPKTMFTDRTIGVEPTANTYLQQGVGRFFKTCLFRFGVDLTDQGWNQTLAKCAQSLGLATVDLSMASDTIAYWLVERLLPPAWFQFLCDLRSEYAVVDGKARPLEKFSSMGNAFTFELESLIFYALSFAVCKEVGVSTAYLSVFGDDIILPAAAYERLSDVFLVSGFSVNSEKSFHEGRFYESCGVHAFDGYDVTPFYQKELLYGLPELVRCHNRVVRWCLRVGVSLSRFREVTSFLEKEACDEAAALKTRVPRQPLSPCGISTDGDTGLLTRGMKVSNIGSQVLLDVLEPVESSVRTISYEALYADAMTPKVESKLRRLYTRLKLFEAGTYMEQLHRHLGIGLGQSFDGFVPLRGDPVYRVRRRWVLVPDNLPFVVLEKGLTRETAVSDFHSVRTLIPQVRSVVQM